MKPFPCKDCKERYLGCSDKCEKYKAVKESNFEERKWVTMKNKEHMCPSAAKYKKAEEKLTRLDTRIRDKEMRNRRIAAFIDAVEQMPDTVSEFSTELWATLIDQVTVYGKKDVRFTLSTGEEIQVD